MVTMCMLAMLAFSMAQTIKGKNMERKEKTIRLVYPQWQGGHVDVFIPEIKDTTAASQGYVLGAQLLNFLAPASNTDTYTVPVSMAPERKVVSSPWAASAR